MPDQQYKMPRMKGEARKYTYAFTLPGLLVFGGAMVLALTAFFILGILIGRGYRPEADVPELARIMPAPTAQANATAAGQPQVLKAEDLDYMDRLKRKPESPEAADQASAGAKPSPAAKPAKPIPTAQAAPAETATPTPAPPAMVGEQVYDYVYQAASFRKRDMAQALADKIAATGLTTEVSSGDVGSNTWHRVMIRFHGTPSQTDEMRDKLRPFGIDKPLLRGKTPAGQ